jgi:hypothetical protein
LFIFCAKKVSIFLRFKDFFFLAIESFMSKRFYISKLLVSSFIFHLSFFIEVCLGFVIHCKIARFNNHI